MAPDQYDPRDLNTERRLDPEYRSDLLAFRPFWEPPPGAPAGRAYIRNTEGSLDTDQLFIRREAGFSVNVATASFVGYRLRQWEDYEQRFFSQWFEAQARVIGPLSLRLFGQPTGKKQYSDIGFGAFVGDERRALQVDWTAVDFNFSQKNLDEERDLRKPQNWRLSGYWAGERLKVDAWWDLDTPLERDLAELNLLFNHRAWESGLRIFMGTWRASARLENHRRSTDDAAGRRTQDFAKSAYRGGLERDLSVGGQSVLLGMELERRLTSFGSATPEDRFDRNRWWWNPYLQWSWRWTERLEMPLALYGSISWDRLSAPGKPSAATAGEAKLAVPLLWRLRENATLRVMAAFDLDEVGSSRTFEGGNVAFDAHW